MSDRPAYNRGADVQLTILGRSDSGGDGDDQLGIRLESSQGDVRDISVPVARDALPRRQITLPMGPPGEYTATLVRGEEAVSQTSFRIDTTSLEESWPEPDLAALKDMAEANGGLYLDLQDAGRLTSEELAECFPTRSEAERYPLWNSPWIAMVFITAVVGSWLNQRRGQRRMASDRPRRIPGG